MVDIRRFLFSHRRPLMWCLVLSLLVVQGLRVHFHNFADHEPLHGHDHAFELHVSGMAADSGHDDPDSETALDKFALLKLKRVHMDDAVPVPTAAPSLFLLVLAGHPVRGPGRLFPPPSGGDVRTPPLRAPPV